MKQKSTCLNCSVEFTFSTCNSTGKYCSNKCQQELKKKTIIEDWLSGKYDGVVSKESVASLSGTIRDFLFDECDNKCVECQWSVVNPHTGKIPLQVHHIDGDALNCKRINLKLLCPNCHSLTPNFGSQNKRCKRKKKTIKYL